MMANGQPWLVMCGMQQSLLGRVPACNLKHWQPAKSLSEICSIFCQQILNHIQPSPSLEQDTNYKHRRASAMSTGALAPMALAMKRSATGWVSYGVLDNSWTEVFDLPKANDDMMDMYPVFTLSSLPPEHLKQDFDVLILECFGPGFNVSIHTDVAFTTDVLIDTITLCMMLWYYLWNGQQMQLKGKFAFSHN